MTKLAIGLGLVLLTTFGTISAAQAQYGAPAPYYPPPQPRGYYRQGFLIGFGVGGGNLSINNCFDCSGPAGGLEFHIGGMINPRMAIMGDFWGMARSVDGVTISNVVSTLALQYWAIPQLWLKGGIGFGNINFSADNSGESFQGDSGLGLTGAIGFEVLQTHYWALDLQLRFAHASYGPGDANMGAFMVGFNWY